MSKVTLFLQYQVILPFSNTFSHSILMSDLMTKEFIYDALQKTLSRTGQKINLEIKNPYVDSRGAELIIKSQGEFVLSKAINVLKATSSRKLKSITMHNDSVWDRGYKAVSVGERLPFEDFIS